ERDRRRDREREKGRVERSPDERKRAEVSRDRVPGLRPPEVQAELRDRKARVLEQLVADRGDEENDEKREEPRPRPEPAVASASPRGRNLRHGFSLPRSAG